MTSVSSTSVLQSGTDLQINKKKKIRIPEVAALLVFLSIEIIVFSFSSPYFFGWANFVNILTAVSVTGVVAAGATILLIAGQLDLSVGSGVAFTGLMMAIVVPSLGVPLGVLISIMTGILIGAINGFLVTVIEVNAFIATLASMTIFRGLTISIGQGKNIPVDGFRWAVIRPFLGVPVAVWVLILIILAVGVLLGNTVFGRTIYAIGANSSAARLVGIKSHRNLFIAFLISGACIAVGGLMNTSLLGATSGTAGLGLEMAAITAVILGGTSLRGGTGSIFGTTLGLLIVGVLSNGLTLLNVASSWQDVASGCLLVLAVSFDVLRQKWEAKH